MAGSFKHIAKLVDGKVVYDESLSLLEGGDYLEAIDELLGMLRYLTGDDPRKLYEAWFNGVPHPGMPNCTFEQYWRSE